MYSLVLAMSYILDCLAVVILRYVLLPFFWGGGAEFWLLSIAVIGAFLRGVVCARVLIWCDATFRVPTRHILKSSMGNTDRDCSSLLCSEADSMMHSRNLYPILALKTLNEMLFNRYQVTESSFSSAQFWAFC